MAILHAAHFWRVVKKGLFCTVLDMVCCENDTRGWYSSEISVKDKTKCVQYINTPIVITIGLCLHLQ